MAIRSKVGYSLTIHDFVNEVLVICPKCEKQAIVHSDFSFKIIKYMNLKLTCSSCGHNQKTKDITSSILYSRLPEKTKYILFGAPVDPFFKLPLWLQETVRGNLFWAYNYEHLEFIRSVVEAKLRERNTTSNRNGSVASRLPRWLIAKSNREEVIKVIKKMRRK